MSDDPLIHHASMAMLALVFLGAFVGTFSKVSAKEILKLPIQTTTATASPVPTVTPSPTASPVPTSSPTPTSTPKATLTLPEIYSTEAVEVTANIVVKRCLFYVNTTLVWLEQGDSDYHVLTVDDLPLILAVMANESACDPNTISDDGYNTIGLMQVAHHNWVGNCIDSVPCNIYWGIWILDRAIEMHGLEMGLAAYNCSLEGIANNACGPTGGVYYSERIRTFWYPRFVEALEE